MDRFIILGFLIVLLTTTAVKADSSNCSICSISNVPNSMSIGAIPWVLACGAINVMFCAPMLFVFGILAFVLISIWIHRRRKK